MIRGDDVDVAAREVGPQRLTISRGSQRWRALRDDAETLEVLLGEKQIMRAGLDRHIHAMCPRLGGHGHAATGADMNDVESHAGLASEQRGTVNGLDLGDGGTRFEKRAGVST